jgi:hypothetical protein
MAPESEVNYNRLVQIYHQEGKGGPPIHLEADFHDRVREYLGKLKASYDQERAKDPSSMKALQLADQLQKARNLQSDILNLRLRKFLLLAHQTLTGGMVETKNFTPEERELFDAMVAQICRTRNRIIDGGPGQSMSQGAFPAGQGLSPRPRQGPFARGRPWPRKSRRPPRPHIRARCPVWRMRRNPKCPKHRMGPPLRPQPDKDSSWWSASSRTCPISHWATRAATASTRRTLWRSRRTSRPCCRRTGRPRRSARISVYAVTITFSALTLPVTIAPP